MPLPQAATLLAHDEPFPGGAVVPPIYQTSLFTFANYAEMADTFAGRRRQPIYSRGDNPTVMEFEAKHRRAGRRGSGARLFQRHGGDQRHGARLRRRG